MLRLFLTAIVCYFPVITNISAEQILDQYAGCINITGTNIGKWKSEKINGQIEKGIIAVEAEHAIHEVWDFFESLPYYEMKPRQDLVSTGYCLVEEGKRYLAYLNGAQIIDIQLIPGIYTGKWIKVEDFKKVFPIKEINHTARLSPPYQTGD